MTSTVVEPIPSGFTQEIGGRLRDWVPAIVVFFVAIALWLLGSRSRLLTGLAR